MPQPVHRKYPNPVVCMSQVREEVVATIDKSNWATCLNLDAEVGKDTQAETKLAT